MKAKQPAVEATLLLGRWRRLVGGHIAFGTGCSCGAASTSVRAQDYEQDILGFLRGRHGADAASIPQLLESIVRGGTRVDPALLADLERSIDSFESLHRGGGGS